MKKIFLKENQLQLLIEDKISDKLKNFGISDKIVKMFDEYFGDLSGFILNIFLRDIEKDIIKNVSEKNLNYYNDNQPLFNIQNIPIYIQRYKKANNVEEITEDDLRSLGFVVNSTAIEKIHTNWLRYIERRILSYNEELNNIKDWIKSPLRGVINDIIDKSQYRTINDLLKGSRDFHNKIKDLESAPIENERGEVVLRYPSGYYWIKIPNEYHCTKEEGVAMGHCGSFEGEAYSLRKDKKPSINLDYDKIDKVILQTKGRANTNPLPFYHPYIVDFIIKMGVKKIEQSYYKAHLDFKISDITDRNLLKNILNHIISFNLFGLLNNSEDKFKVDFYNKFLEIDNIDFTEVEIPSIESITEEKNTLSLVKKLMLLNLILLNSNDKLKEKKCLNLIEDIKNIYDDIFLIKTKLNEEFDILLSDSNFYKENRMYDLNNVYITLPINSKVLIFLQNVLKIDLGMQFDKTTTKVNYEDFKEKIMDKLYGYVNEIIDVFDNYYDDEDDFYYAEKNLNKDNTKKIKKILTTKLLEQGLDEDIDNYIEENYEGSLILLAREYKLGEEILDCYYENNSENLFDKVSKNFVNAFSDSVKNAYSNYYTVFKGNTAFTTPILRLYSIDFNNFKIVLKKENNNAKDNTFFKLLKMVELDAPSAIEFITNNKIFDKNKGLLYNLMISDSFAIAELNDDYDIMNFLDYDEYLDKLKKGIYFEKNLDIEGYNSCVEKKLE